MTKSDAAAVTGKEIRETRGIPDDLNYRPKWRIGIDQIEHAIGNGVRFEWKTFDA